jgi:hypothetical protein
MDGNGLLSHRWLLAAIVCLVLACEPPQGGLKQQFGHPESIPIPGGVEHFSGTNSRPSTWVSFIADKEFSGSLPEGIEEVLVTVNGKPLPLSKTDFTYFPKRRLFWASLPGAPKIGDYE